MKRNSTHGQNYLVLGCKPWNQRLFEDVIRLLPGQWHFVGDPDELSLSLVNEISPRHIFVLHWSWKIPDEIVERYECVCFHMTDVPFGRGGSPLQNLIARGMDETKLTALRMTRQFDAGPVYMKERLSLKGGAEEIYLRAGQLSATMIKRMIQSEPKPVPQKGEVVNFKRRKPEESELGSGKATPATLEELYDFIRMLDAEGYPHAFLRHSGFCFEFTRPALYDGRIVADVKITKVDAKETTK